MNTFSKKDKINNSKTINVIKSIGAIDNLEKDRTFNHVYEFIVIAEFLNRQLTEAQTLQRLSISNGQLNKRVDDLSKLSQTQVLSLLDAHLDYYEYLIHDLGLVLINLSSSDQLGELTPFINHQTVILENINSNGYMKQIGLSLDKLHAYRLMDEGFMMDNTIEFRLVDAYTKNKFTRSIVAKRLNLDETQVLQMVDVINQLTIGDVYSLIKEQEKLINLIYGPLYVCCNEILSAHQNSWGFQADHIKFINDNDLFTKCTHFLNYILENSPDEKARSINQKFKGAESLLDIDEEEFDDMEYYQEDFLEENDKI